MTALFDDPNIRAGLGLLDAHTSELLADAVAICEIPAPTFQEGTRAAHVLRRMRELGLGEPQADEVGDVICEMPGDAGRPLVVLMAHLDTVFGPEVAVTVRRDSHVLRAPGIGDNSVGVAAMLWLGRALRDLPARGTLVLAANVGEEGLGNLRGARAVWAQYGARAHAWVILEGATFNRAVLAGVCSRRLEVTYRGQGGHSWQNFGRASAIHALGRLIDRIATIPVPDDPKTTYNVGIIRGGTTVNTIAAEAGFLLDLRSEDPQALADLHRTVEALITSVASETGVSAEVKLLGDRPGGRLPDGHPLIALVDGIATALGHPVRWEAASTDANVALSYGAAATCLGIGSGGGEHTTDEYLDTSLVPRGMRQVYLVAASLLRGALDRA